MEEFDVVVVGAGAAGLAVSTTLGRYGVRTLLVEQRVESSDLPRATVISTRSMELLRDWRLEDEVLAGGVDADVWLWECPTLARAAEGSAHEVGYPSREQAAVVSPCAPGTVPQDWLEAVLRRHVAALPSARVELGTQLVAVDNAPDEVRATLLDRTGRMRTVRSRYLVAADGAHSPVRRMLGVEMCDRHGAYRGAQVVFRASLWHLLGSIRYALYVVTTPAAPGVFLPAGRGDRWVYGPTDVEDPSELEATRLAEMIREGAGVAGLDPHIERIGPFHSPGQLADRFRVGRTFLVGDAAHRVTPRGGTGMNTALLSGHDLGWKLAWMLQGWAEPDLLDTYEAERRVVAEHNIIRSTDPNGSRRRVVDELSVDLGGRVAHAWLPSASGRVSTLDLLGPGWTLFTGPSREAWDAAGPAPRAPLTVRALDAVTARALGVRGDGALLVRPDGVPIAVWTSSAGASELRRVTEMMPAIPSAHDRAVA
jgi:putative polyketide hydroxylase